MKKVQDEQIDPADYGYQDTAGVVITGKLFNEITMFLDILGREKGFEVGYEVQETMEATAHPDNKPKQFLTPIGATTLNLSRMFDQIHIENVRSGVAVHKDELVNSGGFVSPIAQA